MAFGALLDSQPERKGNLPAYAAQAAGTTFGELSGSSFDNGMYNNRFTSQMSTEREVQDELYTPILEQHGVDPLKLRQDAQQYFSERESEALGGFATNDREAYYAALQDALPGVEIPGMTTITEQAAARSASYSAQFNEDRARSLSNWPGVASFFGEAGAVIADPAQAVAIAATAPMAITARILGSAAIEAGINVAMEAPLAAVRKNWYEQQGRELTYEEMAMDVGFAALFGFGVGGIMSGVYKRMGGENVDIFQGPAWDKDIILGLQEIKDATTITKADMEKVNNSGKPVEPFFHARAHYEPDAPEANPFIQTTDSVVSRVLGAATDLNAVLPEVSYRLTGHADTMSYQNTHPMNWTLRDIDQLDSSGYDFTLHRLDLPARDGGLSPREAHDSNLYDAVDNLLNGKVLAPKHREALTMDIIVANGPERIDDIRAFREGGITVSMKSKPFREHVQRLIRNVMDERLSAIVKEAQNRIPPRITSPGKKPSLSLEKIQKEQVAIHASLGSTRKLSPDATPEYKKAYKEYADTVVDELDWQERSNLRQRRINRDEDFPEDVEAKLDAEGVKKAAAQKKAKKKLESVKSGMKKRLNELERHEREWKVWQDKATEANDYRAGLQAQEDLTALRDGKIPATFRKDAARIEKVYKAMQRNEEVLTRSEQGLIPDFMEMAGRQRTPFEKARAFELNSVTRIADDAAAGAELSAKVAEARRADQSYSFPIMRDGDLVETTMADELLMIDELDQAIDAARVCIT